MIETPQLEDAIWSVADGRGSHDDHSLLLEHGEAALPLLDRIIGEIEDDLDAVRPQRFDERDQVVADFIATLDLLNQIVTAIRTPSEAGTIEVQAPDPDVIYQLVVGNVPGHDAADDDDEPDLPPEPVRLQGSWSAGRLVVWAGGRGTPPEANEQLATRLEAAGGPPHGWEVHQGVKLPNGQRADALSISVADALGWLAVLGRGVPADEVGASLAWLGRVAIEGVRVAALGTIVPTLHTGHRGTSKSTDARVRWRPALLDPAMIDALAASMPGTVTALTGGGGRNTTLEVIDGVVEAIVRAGAARLVVPAQPPTANTPTDLADTIVARMGGAPFPAHADLARDASRRFDGWARQILGERRPLVIRLDPPGIDGVWMASVYAHNGGADGDGGLVPLDEALRAADARSSIAHEWTRIERIFPAFARSRQQRGQVVLTQGEAWDFMTGTGPLLASVGFEVRAPELSRHAVKPSLHLFAEARAGSMVGANQISAVTWSVHFDDVELTAADIARLVAQAKPLLLSRGKWIAIDRVDLEQAAAALSEREAITQMTGAEILRHTVGLDGSSLAGGIVVHGDSWANDILERAKRSSTTIDETPERFRGTLRSYQAEALTWIGFLDASELGGCLALDMGLGKTPTVLAHLARIAGEGTTLVVAPAAVVGNWAAEAAKFTPGLRVVVHHGAQRAEDHALAREVARADIVITTYATAVRDIDALAAIEWRAMVLDEAQSIKNSTSETAQQIRRVPARTKLALTGTPIENGVGDLWSILDFTNPGLVGPRPAFIAQLAGDGETALRALNGILLFRRTKAEPEVAAELPDKIDELDHCTMTPEQIGLYQAVLDDLIKKAADPNPDVKKGAILAAITALKQICNHPAAYADDGRPLHGRSGKLTRLEELLESVFAAGERVLIFTHFAQWGRKLAAHLSQVTGLKIDCYDGDLSRTVRDAMVAKFQKGTGAGAMVLSLKAGGTGLNLTAANHVVLYDRWWNPAVEDQARDRAWRIGQTRTVISHRLVCPGTVDERVEEVVQGKRHIASLVLPKSSSITDLDADQLRIAFGLRTDELLTDDEPAEPGDADADDETSESELAGAGR